MVTAFTIKAAECRPGAGTTGACAGSDSQCVSVPLCHAVVALPGVCGSAFSFPIWGSLWKWGLPLTRLSLPELL